MLSIDQIRQAYPSSAGVTKKQYDRLTEIIATLQLELPAFEVECVVTEDRLVTFFVSRGEWRVRHPTSMSLVMLFMEDGIDIAQLILQEIEPFLADAPDEPPVAE